LIIIIIYDIINKIIHLKGGNIMSEKTLKPILESFNLEEECLYNKHYLFIKGFATGRNLKYTLRALPLARKVHDGQHRKGLVEINNRKYQLPYILHCLKVCSTLISLSLCMTDEELDLLLCESLLHDAIEDDEGFFKNEGFELVTEYGFPREVYDTIKLLSKNAGASELELSEYFNNIKKNKFALLIKLADRSHNVEDLYNMKLEKLHKYIIETRTWIYPLATYAKSNYPEYSNGVTILKSKIVSLTELTETIVNLYEEKLNEKENEINELRRELLELKKNL
jgi:(p)ppGpp synthase/HD superfamily hydrolase